eukprot:m.463609 g.463609  ORF g.463609 m.463609 type:complete len:1116 (-) comp23110_c0_seq1:127-3474(-)
MIFPRWFCVVGIVAAVLVQTSGVFGIRDALFDDGWRFYRGDVAEVPAPCPASAFPLKVGRCMGLHQTKSASDIDGCRAACCANPQCTTWQWEPANGSSTSLKDTCWIGDMFHLQCANSSEGWITGGRNPPSGPSPPGPLPAFAQKDFDDSAWRAIDTPHDWAIEDLPARVNDTAVPAVDIRNGTWRFTQGDEPASGTWSAAGYDDSDWKQVTVPGDWREPPISFEATNATGWYRRNFTLTMAQIQAFVIAPTSPVLALGVVACADQTFVNGVSVGRTNNCIEYRSYALDTSTLLVGENSVAVQVKSPGGPAGLPYGQASPGGLCDTGLTAVNGVSVATGADWTPPSPFDAARSLATGESGRSVGYSTNGVGWYRKTFKVDTNGLASPHWEIRFDGVYMNADFWINNQYLGNHPYGYTSFAFDITPYVTDPNADNVLAVRVRVLGQTSRWYSGAGIFRHVHLTTTPAVRVALYGLAVSTPRVAPDRSIAIANVAVTLANQASYPAASATVTVGITDPNGALVATATTGTQPIPANSSIDVVFEEIAINGTVDGANVSNPVQLWSLNSPNLYTAAVQVESAETDSVDAIFGIRTLSFTTEGGFLLNGESITLNGGCVHHDNGALGSATIDRAEERRVETLKANGYNAIRTSHNPVSPAFLDACDRVGMLVMDEAFDCWERGKGGADYHLYFDAWWQRDIESMVKRDINHPSVIMWSIGNEIPMRESTAGFALAKALADKIRSIDLSGRAITSAVPGVNNNDDDFFAALDVGGYNYSPQRYVSDHVRFPKRIMVGTESFPERSFEMWAAYTNLSWVMGDFIWTAIDYIGESAIGNAATSPDIQAALGQPWQWHISFCGDIDIMGMQKPQAFYRTVLWDAANITMLVHHPMAANAQEKISSWGWPDERDSWTWDVAEGTNMSVRVFSKCSTKSIPGPNDVGAVRLTLNGADVPGSPMNISYATEFMATFNVPYAKGKLEAACTNLQNAGTTTLVTAGKGVALVASVDRQTIRASRSDLAYVTVSVVDANGERIPDARERLKFDVSGVGELAAVGTGDPTDVSSFHQGTRVTYQGRAVAILRPALGTPEGKIVLTISAMDSPTLKPTTVTVTVSFLNHSD